MVLITGLVPFLQGTCPVKKNHRSKYIYPYFYEILVRAMLVSCACGCSTPDLLMP